MHAVHTQRPCSAHTVHRHCHGLVGACQQPTAHVCHVTPNGTPSVDLVVDSRDHSNTRKHCTQTRETGKLYRNGFIALGQSPICLAHICRAHRRRSMRHGMWYGRRGPLQTFPQRSTPFGTGDEELVNVRRNSVPAPRATAKNEFFENEFKRSASSQCLALPHCQRSGPPRSRAQRHSGAPSHVLFRLPRCCPHCHPSVVQSMQFSVIFSSVFAVICVVTKFVICSGPCHCHLISVLRALILTFRFNTILYLVDDVGQAAL